jgi:DNA-binding CsgD family transcriptional regulator
MAGLSYTPPVKAFSKNDYGAARQNWNAAQDSKGLLYFANHAGLLQYDGSNWLLYRMPNQMGIRSVAIDDNNRIYTGSYEEFGYWDEQPDGTLLYHSLSVQLKDYHFNNDEIWRIIITGNKVYFQSFGTYFVYDGTRVIQYNSPEAILFFLKAGKRIITQGMQSGLFQLQHDSLILIPGSQVLRNALIRTALEIDSSRILLGTSSQGLYLYEPAKNRFTSWKTEADPILKGGQINCGTFTVDSLICLGTIGNGMVALDLQGRIRWHFNKDFSLTTNTVLFLCTDYQGNIWAALDQGIAQVQITSPFRYITSPSDNIELVYTAIRFNNSIYIGTNQGAFRMSENGKARFNLLPGTQGQVWQLVNEDGQLLCGHNEGTFRIEGDRMIPLSPMTGGTSIKRISSGGVDYLIQSTYGSLVVFKKDAYGKWIFSHTVRGFSHPVRYLEVDHLGYIWASHFIKGLFRIKLNPALTEAVEVRIFGSGSGLPSDYKINVASLAGRVVFCTGTRIYTYDDLKDQMVPFEWLNKRLGEFASSHLIIPSENNNYWLVKKGRFALITADQDSVAIRDILPFSLLNNNLIDENEYIAKLDNNSHLFCLENGLALYRKGSSSGFKPEVLIRQVKVSSNKSSNLLPIKTSERSKANIPYWYRRIMFTFAYPDHSSREISLHCLLKGNGEMIIDTVTRQLITYAYLNPGQYVLNVEAVDENNQVLGTAGYYFNVKPPFYTSFPAYLIYMLILAVTAYFVRKSIHKHIRMQNEKVRQEQAKLQLERIERREQKITLLKNEKLEAELLHKSKELASSTMAIIRKNEMLLQLKKEVEHQKQKLGSQYPNKYADHLLRLINDNISSDDDWEIFQQNFDLIHENFFRHIKSNYHDLTAHDLKLCAFIRLNLSTKEIASLLNITIRGVEAARYRLRKKFNIPADKNLTEFLIELK